MCWGDAHPISRGFSTGTKLSSLSSVASRASDKNRLRSKDKKESGIETMGRSHFCQVVRSVIHRQLGPGVRGVTVTRTGDSVPAVGGGVSRKRRCPRASALPPSPLGPDALRHRHPRLRQRFPWGREIRHPPPPALPESRRSGAWGGSRHLSQPGRKGRLWEGVLPPLPGRGPHRSPA